VIRRGDPRDVPFLRSLLPHAFSQQVEEPESDVPIGRYIDGWGRSGDTALIAMDEGHSVGAGWYRLFPSSSRGLGFVDEYTPELTVAVVPSRQGEGIGQQLLGALVARAHDDGYVRISATVERAYPEQASLLDLGFEVVAQRGTLLTLARQIG
jgi:GNAT superfamily N-acetyltransferase